MERLAFERVLQNRDPELRLKWHPAFQQYAVERRMSATPGWVRERLKRPLHRMAYRSYLRPGLSPEELRELLLRRRRAASRLDSLNEGYRVLFFVPDTTDGTLHATQYTLRATDLWAEVGRRGSDQEDATKIARERLYEDDRAEARKQASFHDDVRHRGAEAYDNLKYRIGERVSLAR